MDYAQTKLNVIRSITESLGLKGLDAAKVSNLVQLNMDLYFSKMPHVKKFSKLTGCNDVSQAVYCLDLHSWNTGMAVKYFQENAVKVKLQ